MSMRLNRIKKMGRGLALPMIANIVLIYILISTAFSFELSSDSVTSGKNIVVTGTGEPNREHTFQSSFTMNLPVASGKYSYETEVKIPKKPNRFTVTAENVENLNAAVKLGIWITKSFTARGGVVQLSGDDVPSGKYRLKVSGKAIPGSGQVPITVEAETDVLADSKGRYRLDIDTSGIPEGEYIIDGDGDTKIVQILSKRKSSSSPPDVDKLKESDKEEKSEPSPEATSGSTGSRVSGREEIAVELPSSNGKSTPTAQPGKNGGIGGILADWFGL